jgi:hypothetical protein
VRGESGKFVVNAKDDVHAEMQECVSATLIGDERFF